MKTTLKEQLLLALEETGEKPEDLICFYQEVDPDIGDVKEGAPIVQCSFDELPDREFDSWYGAMEGDLLLAYGPNYVYVKVVFEGHESIEAIPRHPSPEKFGNRLPFIR